MIGRRNLLAGSAALVAVPASAALSGRDPVVDLAERVRAAEAEEWRLAGERDDIESEFRERGEYVRSGRLIQIGKYHCGSVEEARERAAEQGIPDEIVRAAGELFERQKAAGDAWRKSVGLDEYDRAVKAAGERLDALSTQLLATRATTPEGVAAKLQLALSRNDDPGPTCEPDDIIESALADLAAWSAG
jgi:hypothetical protein